MRCCLNCGLVHCAKHGGDWSACSDYVCDMDMPSDKLAILLKRVDAEIEKSKTNPMAIVGMCVVKKMIVEMMEEDKHE